MCSNQRNCSLQETGALKAALRKKKPERGKKRNLKKKKCVNDTGTKYGMRF